MSKSFNGKGGKGSNTFQGHHESHKSGSHHEPRCYNDFKGHTPKYKHKDDRNDCHDKPKDNCHSKDSSHKISLNVQVKDGHLQMSSCGPCAPKTDLYALAVLCVTDPRCGPDPSIKITLNPINYGCCNGESISIPKMSFTAADLIGGKHIDGLGTLYYIPSPSKLDKGGEVKLVMDEGVFKSLPKGESIDIKFDAKIMDKSNCYLEKSFAFKAYGGNDAPEIKLYVIDGDIQLKDCDPCDGAKTDLTAVVKLVMSDVDCGDMLKMTLKMDAVTLKCCDGESIHIPGGNWTMAQLIKGVDIQNLGKLVLNGDKLTLTVKEGSLESLADGDKLHLNFHATVTDKAGCTDKVDFKIDIIGGNDAPEIKVGDMCIQLPDCCEGPMEDLKDASWVHITDPDCGDDAALAKVEFMGYSDECCGIEIPAACYTVDELLCGVKLGDLGELKLVDGKLVFKADPMSDGSKSLAEGQTAVLSFVAVASDGECI
ncbi:MAG: hypothetical protein KBB83_06850, partial [Alphaproteobacteria bacterium]|nr:hypothetical protein [Alphaproteobacteria bacterium]